MYHIRSTSVQYLRLSKPLYPKPLIVYPKPRTLYHKPMSQTLNPNP
jgi:hypothetical protein